MSQFAQFKAYLKNVSFLTESDCALFEPFLKTENLNAKENFLEAGKTCRHIGFINTGALRMFYISGDKEINTHFTFENDFVVDYDSFLTQKAGRYFIQAMEDTQLVTFNFDALQNAYQQSKNWERFGRIIAEQSYKLTTTRVESFLFLDGEQRYTQLLGTAPHIFDRVPLYHIASYLGLERESLSRLRKKIAGK